jgi:hypothetical protein
MTSDKRPRVFVSRIIPDEGLQPIIAQTDADVWQDELPPERDELPLEREDVDLLEEAVAERVVDLVERANDRVRQALLDERVFGHPPKAAHGR